MTDSTPTTDPYRARPLSPAEEKNWSLLVHIGGAVLTLTGLALSILPSLVAFVLLKDRGPFVRAHTAAALNFQITAVIAYAVGALTTILLIGFVIIFVVWLLSIIFSIMAAVAANKGEYYRYPLAITFVR